MSKTKILISLIILLFCCLIGTISNAQEKTVIKVSYKYKEETNTVIATMTSNNELQNTKPATSWKLSEDRKRYTFEFGHNTTYMSSVIDIYGNKISVPIKVTQIDESPAHISVGYQYKEDTNTVIATMTSNRELQNTKPATSWKLSNDKMQYTFEFGNNTTYMSSVIDRFGNKIQVPIKVTQIDESPAQISVRYQYKEDTNTVIATMTSNRELQNTKPSTSWKLSSDKKQYTFEFGDNTTYMSSVVDIYGNKISVPISVTQIDDKGPEIKIEYQYNQNRTQCIVTVTSNEEMIQKTTPGWKLSTDKKTYTYIATKSQNIVTNFNDKYRNPTTAHINIYLEQTGIDVSKHNGKIDWQKVKDSGIQFAIIRVGYGENIHSQDDTMFEYNISECERLGIPYGVYLYSYALNTKNALSEAEHVLRLIKGHNPEYGIWYDLEEDNYKIQHGMPTNEEFTDIAITFCEKIKASGYENVGIYANHYWWDFVLNSPRLDVYQKWVAQWGDKCTYDKEYVMWQYTDQGKVDGILGNVDMNKYYR